MTTHRFRTIGFDLDGTVADTAPDLAAALNHTLEAMGRPGVQLDQVRSMIGHGARALLRKGLAATGEMNDALVDQGYPIMIRFYEDHICDLSRPYPGVEAALDVLAESGVALALCTNKPERMARLLVDAFGWQGRFASIVGGDTLPTSKPDAAPLLLAIDQAGGGPAAFVGDSIVDVDAARAAGVPVVAVSFGFSDRPASDFGADAVIDHFDDLLSALAAL